MPAGPTRIAACPSAARRAIARHWAVLFLVAVVSIAPGLTDTVLGAVAVDAAGPPAVAVAVSEAVSEAQALEEAAAPPSPTPSPAFTTTAAPVPTPLQPRIPAATLTGSWTPTPTPMLASPTPGAPSKPAVPRWSGRYNLFRTSAFVTQKDFKWCVAASVQMMVNIVRHTGDRTRATQARMIRYAQASDNGPYGPEGGTDVTGWISALRHFGAGKYRAVGATTAGGALRIAAIAMRQTGRPAGILVMDGRHAWVLTGFESRTDPRLDRRARITSVRVSGPLYPIQQKNGYDLRPNTELSVAALARYFLPSSVGALVGKYVVIVPTH